MASFTSGPTRSRIGCGWRVEAKNCDIPVRLLILTFLNGLTLAALYFMVASGFTLVFGLMRQVNLAHGSLYLLGGYLGFEVGDRTGSWLLALLAGFFGMAIVGAILQV